MSDNYIIICTKKEVGKPKNVISILVKWLQSNEVVETELSDCVMGMKHKGFRPAKKHIEAIGFDENITRLKVCGVETITQRTVFNSGGFTPMSKMLCPKCQKNRFEGFTPQDFFTDNLSKEQLEIFNSVFPQFYNWENHREATLTCPHCFIESDIDKYEVDNSICLSNSGLIFWNWSQLMPEFIKKMEIVIDEELEIIVGNL